MTPNPLPELDAPAVPAGLTLRQRCDVALQSLPQAQYRDMLARLFDELLGEQAPAPQGLTNEARNAARWRWFRLIVAASEGEVQDAIIDALAKVCAEPKTPEDVDRAVDTVMAQHSESALRAREAVDAAADIIESALRAQGDAGAPEPANPWKDAVLDALANCCMDAPLDEPPRSILKRVIACEVQIALDPAVSSEAQALIDKGAAGVLDARKTGDGGM